MFYYRREAQNYSLRDDVVIQTVNLRLQLFKKVHNITTTAVTGYHCLLV